MSSLNVGWWNSTKLHIFKISNLKQNDLVISAKLKIMDILQLNNLEKLDLIYCGLILENMEKISFYVKDTQSFVFLIKNQDTLDNIEKYPTKDTKKMFEKYNEVYKKPGFKELLLSLIKPETITELVNAIPQLSEDLVALSLIKDIFLFESILKPSVLKTQLTKHPSLLMSVDYLIHNVVKNINGRLRAAVHLTDEDYSETDDIEIDYNQPNVSTFDTRSIPELSFLFRNNSNDNGRNLTSNEEVNDHLFQSSIFEDVLMDVFDDEGEQQFGNGPSGLSSQLHQMHEIGLYNDLLNFRALQVAGGNIQHAVELILNRIIE